MRGDRDAGRRTLLTHRPWTRGQGDPADAAAGGDVMAYSLLITVTIALLLAGVTRAVRGASRRRP
jgi:hypothetical protein